MIFIFLSNFLVMYFIKFLTPFACFKASPSIISDGAKEKSEVS